MPLFVTEATSRTGVPFPDAPLAVVFEQAFGADLSAAPHTWSWTDMTSRLLADEVTVTRGLPPGGTEAAATTGTVTLANDDGHLTPGNPASPYTITRAVPGRLRVYPHVDDIADDFDRPAAGATAWGTVAQPWAWVATVPYDLATDFALTGAQAVHRVQAPNHYRISYRQMTAPDVDLYGTVTLEAMPTDGACNVGFAARMRDTNSYLQLRARVIAASGAVWLDLLRRVGGAETTLASANSGLTYTPGTPLHLHARVDGPDLHIKVWFGADNPPAAWSLSATDTMFTTAGLGHGVRSGITNTATALPGMFWDNVAMVPFSTRLAGHCDDWKPTFVPSSGGYTWSQVQVGVSGIRRRLERGQPPARSPIRAAAEIYRAAGQPLLAYWPLEDESDAKRAVNVVDDRRPMAAGTLPVGWAEVTPPAPTTVSRRWGTAPLVDLSEGGRLTGAVPAGVSSPSQFAVRMLAAAYAPAFGADIPLAEIVFTGGPYARWVLVQISTGVFVQFWDQAGGFTWSGGVNFATTGLGQYQVDAIQDGADIEVRLWAGTSAGSGFVATVLSGKALARVARVTVNPSSVVNSAVSNDLGKQWTAGHVQVWDTRIIPITADSVTNPDLGWTSYVWQAWAGETADGRVRRLCAQESVPVLVQALTDPGLATQMGAQPDLPLLPLLAECARTDGGLLTEAGFALAYLPRGERYNRPAAMTIDLATYRMRRGQSGDVLAPVFDDEGLVNDATVKRTAGSEARSEDLAHIAAHGRYSSEREANVLSDDDPPLHAAWDVHLGTTGGMRYPDLPIDLAANPDLIGAWLSVREGDRITRINPPAGVHASGPIDQVLYGWTETLGPGTWTVKGNCGPYAPWRVAVVDDGAYGVVASDTAAVAGPGYDADDTVILVADSYMPWTTDPSDWPIAVTAATGEQMSVTAIAGAASPQTWTVVRGVNGVNRPLPAGTRIDVSVPMIPGL